MTDSSPQPDLTVCEREPIHIPAAIEPNGGMLVFGGPELTILQASSNMLALFGSAVEDLLGKRLGELFSEQNVERLLAGVAGDGKRHYVAGLRGEQSGRVFDALVHRHHGLLILELEPASNAAAGQDIYTSLTDAVAELQGPLALADLCQRMAARIRQLTGFDRVMVYRFLEDDSGSVIAEDRREDLIPYLGLRYPASDIPAQARRLYLVNTLRLKADVAAPRAVLIPSLNPLTGEPLDMTYCILRAMSPVHVEYLRNMGVAASMSISILKDHRLWGLIACHHSEARLVPHSTRITCEVLARVFSSHIASAEERDQRNTIAALRDLTGRIEQRMRQDHNVAASLSELSEDLTPALRARGCAFSIRGKTVLSGQTPARERVDALLAWLSSNQNEHLLATERLTELYPGGAEFSSTACGLLSIRIALGSPDFVLCFRPAVVQVIHWAGNPEKPVEETEAGRRISPRRSFEKWKQIFRDSSEPWTAIERDFAAALRPMIAETLLLQMNEEVLRLNLELSRSNVELGSFAYAASHDLQEPVRMVRAYAQLLARQAGPDLDPDARAFLTTIENSANRMGSLIKALLSYSQLGGAERRESKPVSLDDVLRWVIANLDEQIRESGAVITHETLPVVLSDLDHMVQLLQNLISNAIKYRRPDAPPRVHVACRPEHGFALLAVRDNGQGFEPQHSEIIFGAFKRLHGREIPGNGIGLATCKRIVEIHHGRIWAESDGVNRGATFWFTLPSASADHMTAGKSA